MPKHDPESRKRLLIAAAALVDGQGRVLLQKRPEGKPLAGLWEFPGGKVEAAESPIDGLIRELREELGLIVEPGSIEPFAFASVDGESQDLLLLLYLVRAWSGDARPLVADELRWCSLGEMEKLPMPPADVPLVKRLSEIL